MSSISFHSLQAHNYEGWQTNYITIELRASFDIQDGTRLMYAVYNSKNEIIDTLVNGFRNYYNQEFIYPKFDSRNTSDGIITVKAWLVGTTLVRRYDIGTTKGAKEFNKISNVASKTISLRGLDPIIPPHEKQEIPTFTGIAHGTKFDRTRGQIQTQEIPTVVTGTKPFEKPERVSVFQPKKTFSQNTQNIINGIESRSITVPSWFMNNVTWVKSGQITESEFVNAYNFLTPQKPEVTLPEVTLPSIPEVSAEMELTTTNFQVIIPNVTRYSTSLSNADYNRLKDEMTLESRVTLVFLNQTNYKPLTTFYQELRKIQKFLEGKIVETISPTGKIIPEPVTEAKPGLMGAGVLGVIGILMLSGFIADHVRKRK
jgi:hypothetical protein